MCCEDGESEADESAVESISFHILLHSNSPLYYTLVKGSQGDVFFFTSAESAPRGGNIAFCVPGAAVAKLFELLVRD